SSVTGVQTCALPILVSEERIDVTSPSSLASGTHQGERTPTDVDPVVAFVDGCGRSQVDDRVRDSCVRDARAPLPAAVLELGRDARTIAVRPRHCWVAC